MKKIKRTPSGGYGQDWAAYNAAQINEQKYFLHILYELCKEIIEPLQTIGRTSHSMRDMVLCLVYKVYSTFSARRFVGALHQAQALGLISAVPSPNSISEYMRGESVTTILKDLLTKSSLPVAGREQAFAADSTGLRLPHRRKWFNRHENQQEMRRDYMKLHVMIGVSTNIITCAETSAGTEHDCNYLKCLVKGTARYFDISEVSADAAYLSGENLHVVLLAGGVPYIAFKKNCALDADYKSEFWKDLLYLHKTRNPVFMDHYFLRNNVEATFRSIKAKFGGWVRSKTVCGQFNEALCKALCHNICVLIQSTYELGIDPTSWASIKPRPESEAGLTGAGLKHREKDLASIRVAASPRKKQAAQETSNADHKPKKALLKCKKGETKQTSLFETEVNA
jgi:transposase